MKRFNIELVSVPDRKGLVAEIWFEDNLICEICDDNGFEIEFFTLKNTKFNYNDFLEILNIAKEKLVPNF